MLEKFHLRGGKGNQDPGDPGMGKVRGGGGFFFLQAGEGTDPGWHYEQNFNTKSNLQQKAANLFKVFIDFL